MNQLKKYGGITLLILSYLIINASSLQAQQPTNSQSISKKFVQGFLAQSNMPLPQIFSQSLPDNIKHYLQLPDGIELLGSIVYRHSHENQPYSLIQVIAETKMTPSKFFKEIKSSLSSIGWYVEPSDIHPKSFKNNKMIACRKNMYLELKKNSPTKDETFITMRFFDADMNVNVKENDGRCMRKRTHKTDASDTNNQPIPFPDLKSPNWLLVRSAGYTQSGDNYSHNVKGTTKLNVIQLFNSYAKQLKKKGWGYKGGTKQANLGDELWVLTKENGEKWSGVLFATKIGGADRYKVSFSMTKMN